jgi:hypothetical protein
LKGTLYTPYPVVSSLKQNLLGHLDKVSKEQGRRERPKYLRDAQDSSHSPMLNALVTEHETMLRHKNRLHIEDQIKEETQREDSVAIIRETIYKTFTLKRADTQVSNWVNYNNIILRADKADCDVNCLMHDFTTEELKTLGQREMRYRYPDSQYKKLLTPFVVAASLYYSKASPNGHVLWKFALEENEFRIKIGTPMTIIGDFTFSNGKLVADKIDVFGKNLYHMVKDLESSDFIWKVTAGVIGTILGVYGLYKLQSVLEGRKEEKKNESKLMN